MRLEIAEPLVEAAVRLAIAEQRQTPRYFREREPLYEIADAEERESAFRSLHRRWFVRLGLDRSLEQAFDEARGLDGHVARCLVGPARRPKDEGSELFVRPSETGTADRADRTLAIRVLPATLADGSRLLWLLRRELLHVTDMLDPSFLYEPELSVSPAGPVHDLLLRDRYSVLWSTTVVGRLSRRGHAPPGATAEARARLLLAFPMLESKAEEALSRLWSEDRPTHFELERMAADPRRTFGLAEGQDPGMPCPVCRFPSYTFESLEDLGAEVAEQLRTQHAECRTHDVLCPRCADVYRARAEVFPPP